MPNCKKCSSDFCNSAIIENKLRNLQNRRFCLNCLPFKQKIPSKPIFQNLICVICGKKYLYHHDDSKGHNKLNCNSCQTNKRRWERKEKAVEYKGGKCEKCGYQKCLRALSFHHLDSSQKDFSIGGSHCNSWEKVKKELDKCILVCANCHMEIHEEIEKKEKITKISSF